MSKSAAWYVDCIAEKQKRPFLFSLAFPASLRNIVGEWNGLGSNLIGKTAFDLNALNSPLLSISLLNALVSNSTQYLGTFEAGLGKVERDDIKYGIRVMQVRSCCVLQRCFLRFSAVSAHHQRYKHRSLSCLYPPSAICERRPRSHHDTVPGRHQSY